MDGLEIIEISFSKVLNEDILRLESSFWSAKNDKNIQTIKGADIIDLAQYGTSKELNEQNEGYLTLRINEFENIFITTPSKSCNLLTENDYESLKLKTGDVLISRTNGNPNLVGKTAVVMEDTSFVYASYLFKIRPKKDIINAETLTVFLNSKYGRNEINKYSMTSNQTNFSPAKFREIDIPIFSNELQNKVQNNVMISYRKLEESKKLYTEAEELLMSELGLNDFVPSDEPVAIKSFSESFSSSGRLDAEYYQAKYDEIIARIKCYKGGNCTLKDLGKFTNGSFIPEEFYTEHGQKAYIRIKELSFNSPINEDVVIYIADKFQSTNETAVQKNDYVIATIGNTIGKINLITENFSGSFISNNTSKYALFDSNAHFHYFELLLRSFLVQEQIQREFTQTAQPKISNTSLENIIIPMIADTIQKEIEKKISESFTLRADSKRLLEEAKIAVERAIEVGERNDSI